MRLHPASVCFALAALAAVRCSSGEKSSWTYASVFDWTSLPDNTCAKEQQSPIDIITLHAKTDDLLQAFQYNVGEECKTATLKSDGTTWMVEYKDWQTCSFKMFMMFRGKKYYLKQLTFHTPSEHSIDGIFYDMEAQLLHEDWHKNQLVVAIMMQVNGVENSFLERLKRKMPTIVNETMYNGAETMNPYKELMPGLFNRAYYTYKGSLSRPPCTTGVDWAILETPIGITMDQRTQFRAAISNVKNTRVAVGAMPAVGATLPWPRMIGSNNRPIQAMGATHKLYHWPPPWPVPAPITEGIQEADELYGSGNPSQRDNSSPSTMYVVVALGSAIVLGFSVGSRLRRVSAAEPEDSDSEESMME